MTKIDIVDVYSGDFRVWLREQREDYPDVLSEQSYKAIVKEAQDAVQQDTGTDPVGDGLSGPVSRITPDNG